jgi:hypothetical protein
MNKILFALVAVVLAVVVSAGSPTETEAGGARFTARGTGRGPCYLITNSSFLCKFEGQFRGRLDGVRRQGRFRLSFIWDDDWLAPVGKPAQGRTVIRSGQLQMLFTPTNEQPRLFVRGGPNMSGSITRNNATRGFDVSLNFPLTGGLAGDMSIEGPVMLNNKNPELTRYENMFVVEF